MFYSCTALKSKQAQLFCRPGLDAALPLCSMPVEAGIAKRGWSGNCKEGLEFSPPFGTCCSATGATAPPPQAYSERTGSAPEIAIAFPISLVYCTYSPGCFARVTGSAHDELLGPPSLLLS